MMRRGFLLALLVAAIAAPTHAHAKDTQRFLGSYGNWRAYASTDVCYMALTQHFPKKKGQKRGVGYLMITHRPTAGSTDVVSFMAGYNFKAGTDAKLRIGGNSYDLFTQSDTAWARDTHTDHVLAAAIRSQSSLSFTGTSAGKGAVAITDTLNLKGAADAYRAIGKACGVKTDAPVKAKPKTKAKTPAKKKSPSPP